MFDTRVHIWCRNFQPRMYVLTYEYEITHTSKSSRNINSDGQLRPIVQILQRKVVFQICRWKFSTSMYLYMCTLASGSRHVGICKFNLKSRRKSKSTYIIPEEQYVFSSDEGFLAMNRKFKLHWSFILITHIIYRRIASICPLSTYSPLYICAPMFASTIFIRSARAVF